MTKKTDKNTGVCVCMEYPHILLPRSVRNHNPGNIKSVPENLWDGEIGIDAGGFCLFKRLENGCRAQILLLIKYYAKHQLHTIEAIVRRWNGERQSDLFYVEYVSKMLGIDDVAVLTRYGQLVELAIAMAQYEAGNRFYPDSYLYQLYRKALINRADGDNIVEQVS